MESKSIAKTFRDELIAKHNMRVKITKRGIHYGEICRVVDKKGNVFKVATSDGDKLFAKSEFNIMPTPEEVAVKQVEEDQIKAFKAEVKRVITGPYDKKTMDYFEVHMCIVACMAREKIMYLAKSLSESLMLHRDRLDQDVMYGEYGSGALHQGMEYEKKTSEYATIIEAVKHHVANKMNMQVPMV